MHAVGDGVTNVAVGDTVILHPQPSCGLCRACRAGKDMQCANAFFPGLSDNDGGMAEYLRTTARACVKLDLSTNPADVASPTPGSSYAVRKALPLHPGTTAVVQGAGGWATSASSASQRSPGRGSSSSTRTRMHSSSPGDRRGPDRARRR